MNNQLTRGVIFLTSLVILIYLFVRLVLWARKGGKGAILVVALLAVFTPDPIYEKNCRSVQEARHYTEQADDSGDPPTT
jgi:hypothetical protein